MSSSKKCVLAGVAVTLAAIQLVRPEASNPPVEWKADFPPQVAAILDRSCRDCHSHTTRWPWYSQVAPASWFVRGHVNEGRQKWNYSKWAPDPHELSSICREVSSGAMPLPSYTWIHREAKLSPEEVTILCDWTREESK
jgi:hypothetical protein